MEPTIDEITMVLIDNPDLLREVVEMMSNIFPKVMLYTDAWLQADADRADVLWDIATDLVDAMVTGMHEADLAECLVLEWENCLYSEALPEWYNEHYRDVLLGFVEDRLVEMEGDDD